MKGLLAVSFFKERKLSYFLDKKKSVIVFPCPKCEREATMSVHTTDWECSNCGNDGNLVKLMNMNNITMKTTTIYNPKKEWNAISSRFRKLIDKHGDEIDGLYERTKKLISYYDANR